MVMLPLQPDQDDLDAIRGIRIPSDLSCFFPCCVVYGIRHHDTLARSKEVEELCATSPMFARARNARFIMSNEVPDMPTDDVKPYCIWYPEVASEETYRKLTKQYPDMIYSVGRACAVAGYDRLYYELGILPEVSIAEEARDNAVSNPGSKAIFDHIMSQPMCYAILNDYTRTTNLESPRYPAFMNGDTAVRSLLDVRIGLSEYKEWSVSKGHYFDIVEDNYVAETSSKYDHEDLQELAPEYVDLMYTPLPPAFHLPTLAKDTLILMAAYEGNLDRYVRLRRPRWIHREAEAIIRGIYHNTTFAKYWSLQDLSQYKYEGGDDIRRATIARFIMVNHLSHITPTYPFENDMPGMIWWPLLPREETLRELARRRPDMRLQVAMTCIAANYERLWDELEPEPHPALWKLAQGRYLTAATQPVRSYYTDYLARREAEGREISIVEEGEADGEADDAWQNVNTVLSSRGRPSYYGSRTEGHELCDDAAVVDKEPTSTYLHSGIVLPVSGPEHSSVYSSGRQASAAGWELFICSSEEMRQKARERGGFPVFCEDDYPLSLYPRHYAAEWQREYDERVRERQGREKREGESEDAVELDIDVI